MGTCGEKLEFTNNFAECEVCSKGYRKEEEKVYRKG